MFEKFKAPKKVSPQENNIMSGINSYGKQLSESEIQQNKHRDFIGGKWEEIGQLQFNFLLEQGLKPEHKLLDIGCGCLRGGLHFIEYLQTSKYYGLDINASLIDAAQREIKLAQLSNKKPNLLVTEQFEITKFKQQFDFMVSISLFTHLPMNIIIRCLSAVSQNLAPQGKYYATFFLAPTSAYLTPLSHEPGGIITSYDRDPFHYSLAEINFMASLTGLKVNCIGDWRHPRNQQMIVFSLASN